jgi:hypothetical protein
MANKSWGKTIEAVKTPLGFFALVILVSEGLILYLIKGASGTNLTVLTLGCVLLPFGCMVFVYLLNRSTSTSAPELSVKPEVKPPSGRAYELFVSAPMAAFETEKEFQSSRNAVFDVVRGIKKSCNFKSVFYAGNEIESQRDFESEDISVVEDYDACYRSTYFMLIYPQKLATSALIELGWAMAHKKPTIIFAKRREDLPFLARNADAVFSNIRIYEYKTSADITNKFYPNGIELFKQLTEHGAKR